jgi:hypothetical protein
MQLLGQLEHGVYVDECDQLSLEDIQQNYVSRVCPVTSNIASCLASPLVMPLFKYSHL